jgi:hypothetical protein
MIAKYSFPITAKLFSVDHFLVRGLDDGHLRSQQLKLQWLERWHKDMVILTSWVRISLKDVVLDPFPMRPYKPRSRFTAAVTHKRTLTAKSQKCQAKVQIHSLINVDVDSH